jgi:hypothetical protein
MKRVAPPETHFLERDEVEALLRHLDGLCGSQEHDASRLEAGPPPVPRSIAVSEQRTFATNPHNRGRYPSLCSHAARTRSVRSPPPKPGIRIAARPSPRGRPMPRNTGSTRSWATSSCQRISRRCSPHQRPSGGSGGRWVDVSVGEDIRTRSFRLRLVIAIAELLRRGFQLARAFRQPRIPSPATSFPTALAPARETHPWSLGGSR